ncbi:hypothetical protein [Nitrosomonas ureae]|uniref:Uncharacterized protein n=1 Tax=Nitrosomonas ureae TaxID=44577 RepID=A0A2T5HZR9_9PROT|nr:hypothetical protein [Nitrosomonas ureae]PTQ77079.1 hypothetical protein C8R28_10792 [Nitrosomonas ureae]
MCELLKQFPVWLQFSIVLIPVISLAIAALAFSMNVRQTKLTNALVRAKVVSDSLHTFMNDETIQNAFYKVEYREFQYNLDFHGSGEEKEIDKLLRHFSNLALMWKNDLITLKDIHPIQYFILRAVSNPEIEKYLSFIDNWSKKADTGGHPYVALRELYDKLKSTNRNYS